MVSEVSSVNPSAFEAPQWQMHTSVLSEFTPPQYTRSPIGQSKSLPCQVFRVRKCSYSLNKAEVSQSDEFRVKSAAEIRIREEGICTSWTSEFERCSSCQQRWPRPHGVSAIKSCWEGKIKGKTVQLVDGGDGDAL